MSTNHLCNLNSAKNLTALILAAGKGSRVGMPKWQLVLQGKTFLEIIVANLKQADINQIIVVANAESVPPDSSDYSIVINPAPEKGMISSIYCGIQHSKNASGYLIFPVDHPCVSVQTILALRKEFLHFSENIIIPEYQNIPGHPVIIPQHIAAKIPATDYAGGLAKFLHASAAKVSKLAVADVNILKNINYLSDINFS